MSEFEKFRRLAAMLASVPVEEMHEVGVHTARTKKRQSYHLERILEGMVGRGDLKRGRRNAGGERTYRLTKEGK